MGSSQPGPPAGTFVFEKVIALGEQPEALAKDGNAFFVSTMGKEPGTATDGSIQRLNPDGSVDADFSVHAPLHEPMGLAVIGNKLAVVDINKIVILAKKTGELLTEIALDISKGSFLNDLTKISDRQVAVSATGMEKLLLADIVSGEVRELILDFKLYQPNGLFFDPQGSLLYITRNKEHGIGNEGNGCVTKATLDVAGGRVRCEWSTPIGKFLDGIDLKGDSILVSDWVSDKADGNGAVYELDSRTGKVIARESLGIPGFADLAWDEANDRLACLSLLGNEIRFYRR